MPEVEQRLMRCFQAVFPTLEENVIRSAHKQHISAWDSLASVTLIRTIDEEFGLPIDLFDLEDMDGFEALRDYIASKTA
jgi:acyl carrier protein